MLDDGKPDSWIISGGADDIYEVIFDPNATFQAIASEMSVQNSVLKIRNCNSDEMLSLMSLIEELLTCPETIINLENKLKEIENIRSKIGLLDKNRPGHAKAIAALKDRSRLPKGTSRTRRYAKGQVDSSIVSVR